mgnify:FL=1
MLFRSKAEVVVQDAKAYQAMLEGIEALQAKAGIAEGIASMERGEGEAAPTVFAQLRKKHGLKPAK